MPTERTPCDVCKRVHRGPRCKQRRQIPMQITLPPHVHAALLDQVPWGERSGFIARVLAAHLDV